MRVLLLCSELCIPERELCSELCTHELCTLHAHELCSRTGAMPTHPAPRHVVPLWARRGDHRASPTCPCQPVPAADLADPHVAVYVHRFLDARA